MTYKHFYRTIIIHLLIIVFLSVGTTWLFFIKHAIILSLVTVLIMIITSVRLIRYFNNINRWMSYFLLGIENEDSTLKVPSKTGNKAINEVYKGIQRLNELFSQAKIDISSQEKYFHSIINQSATGLFSVNNQGRVININPAAMKLTDLIEFHHVNTLKSIDKSLPDFIMRDLTAKQNSTIFENRHGQKLLFQLSEITLKNEPIKLVAVSDITKELDSREVDAWIKLARTLSHEIMNNIAPVTSLSKVILGYFIKNNKTVNVSEIDKSVIKNTITGLNVIEERSIGLINFVENYRKFTKLPEPTYEKVDISKLIEQNLIAIATFKDFNKIKVEKSIPEKYVTFIDGKLLSQVIINLLKNACEALLSEQVNYPILYINLQQFGKQIKIEISNNGPQILPEVREQIFVPFFTTKEDGTGIGLSLSKQIMLSMGGDIVLSPDSKFTVFTITL